MDSRASGPADLVDRYVGAVGGHEGVKLEQPVLIGENRNEILSEYPLELDYL